MSFSYNPLIIHQSSIIKRVEMQLKKDFLRNHQYSMLNKNSNYFFIKFNRFLLIKKYIICYTYQYFAKFFKYIIL